ncbi:MAG: hypothetical protein ACLSA6_14110 [Holdemania massiliensis]
MIPQINAEDIFKHQESSPSQLRDDYRADGGGAHLPAVPITRMIVSTYQAVSGAGLRVWQNSQIARQASRIGRSISGPDCVQPHSADRRF